MKNIKCKMDLVGEFILNSFLFYLIIFIYYYFLNIKKKFKINKLNYQIYIDSLFFIRGI